MKLRLRIRVPQWPAMPFFRLWNRIRQPLHNVYVRTVLIVAAILIVGAQAVLIIQPHLIAHTYALGGTASLLPPINKLMANKLAYDAQQQAFTFNAGYSPLTAAQSGVGGGGPQISAVAYEDPTKGIQVTDPLNKLDFTIKPQFPLLSGKQDGNRVLYPLRDGTGWVVYTMQATQVKEDILLDHANGNVMSLPYALGLGDGLVARHESDDSVGIYGSSLPVMGEVSTGSDKDAALLQKARDNAAKDKLFFSLPAPIVSQQNGKASTVRVRHELKGSVLTTVATNLKAGDYPLTIDPAVTVTAATDLFRDTNPESNADFDSGNGDISRGSVTGGVIPAWTTGANAIGTNRFLSGATIYDNYAYVAGGTTGTTTSSVATVAYARLGTTGIIGTWSTTTSLPASLSRFVLLAYNGYLYAIGGATTDTTCGTVSTSIYYNRIQTNGTLTATWNTGSMPSGTGAGQCGVSAGIYNNTIYISGGRTGSAITTGQTGMFYANVNPDGSIGSFTSDDSVLPNALYDADMRIYNDYIYMIGGTLNGGTGGTPSSTVVYAPIDSGRNVYGVGSASWHPASTLKGARTNLGAVFTASNDGFMYVQAGCSILNSSQSCTTVNTNTQIAQINADGTLGPWSDVSTSIVTLSRVGAAVVEWHSSPVSSANSGSTMYSFAGCTGMNSGSVSCSGTLGSYSYSPISTPGQVGPLKASPTDTPSIPQALFAHGAVVNNGYLYIVGGCNITTCQTAQTTGSLGTPSTPTSDIVYYAALNADGSTGSWQTDTHLLNGTTGLAAFSLVVYNNYLYAIGGYTKAAPLSSILFAHIGTSGALTTGWTATATGLAATNTYMSAVAYHGFLYVIGGCTAASGSIGCSTYTATVYRFVISSGTGDLSTRTTANTTALSVAKAIMATAFYNGYIYLAGGADGTNAQTNTVFYAKIQTNGSITSWSSTTSTLVHTIRRGDATAMNGYLYVFGGHDASVPTTYADIEIAKIDMSTGNITTGFTNSVIQITPRWDGRSVYSNGYMYMTGGCSVGAPPATCSTISSLNEYVEVYNAGNKGNTAWTNSGTVYSSNRVAASSTAYNGYLYVAGGCNAYTVGATFALASTFCGTGVQINTVAYAAINADGSLGSWTTSANGIVAAGGDGRANGCLVGLGNTLYYVGGDNSAASPRAAVMYSQIGAAGAPGVWAQATNGLLNGRAAISCGTFNNRIYATGGLNSVGADTATVYYSPSLSAGGDITSTWTALTSFTTVRAHHTAVVVGGYLYVMGGDDGTNALFDTQYVQLDPTTGAAVGSWIATSDMPYGVSYQSAIGANGYIYLFGGRTAATACVSNTYIASVNSTGMLSGWSQGVNANALPSARFGTAAAFNNGYFYIAGGNDCTSVLASNVQYGGEQSQGMQTFISKYADFGGNGYARSFVGYLTNAVNNGVDIEKWRLNYVSSMEATNAWGQNSSVYPLVSESVSAVSQLDGSGTDVRLSRWFWMSWDIDMSQSFTFTDDTQPTILQYELYYSPPPSKRLMHGKDFRDQTQQDLDTHP